MAGLTVYTVSTNSLEMTDLGQSHQITKSDHSDLHHEASVASTSHTYVDTVQKTSCGCEEMFCKLCLMDYPVDEMYKLWKCGCKFCISVSISLS